MSITEISMRKMAIVVPEMHYAQQVPKWPCLKTYARPSSRLLDQSQHLFVWVSVEDLASVSPFVKEANLRHHLRGLFVETNHDFNLLPQLLHQANLRVVKNMFVHQDATVPRRVLNAYCIGAEDKLVANAEVIKDKLHVLSCSAAAYTISFDDWHVLGRIEMQDRVDFEIAEDGGYIHWPSADVHLDIESIRAQTDEGFRKQLLVERLERNERMGQAIATLRKTMKLRQGDIKGLSDRQVRRIERGEGTKVAAFKSLAKAHGMGLDEYLSAIAEVAHAR